MHCLGSVLLEDMFLKLSNRLLSRDKIQIYREHVASPLAFYILTSGPAGPLACKILITVIIFVLVRFSSEMSWLYFEKAIRWFYLQTFLYISRIHLSELMSLELDVLVNSSFCAFWYHMIQVYLFTSIVVP